MSIRIEFAQGTPGVGRPRRVVERHKARAVEPRPYGNTRGVKLADSADNITPTSVRHAELATDQILAAFHQACARGDRDCAMQSLLTLKTILDGQPLAADNAGRRDLASVVANFQRRRQSQCLELEEY